VRRRVPPKSLGGREEVSLSAHAVIAPGVPPPGYRLVLIARGSLKKSRCAAGHGGTACNARTWVMYQKCRYVVVKVRIGDLKQPPHITPILEVF